jgi:hypothetical protein
MIHTLTIAEALTMLENGAWHSVAYVSANRSKQQGGEIIRIDQCHILQRDNTHVAQVSTAEVVHTTKKSQNHSLNATRNLRLRNGAIRKMHIYLLFSLNNIPVI